MSDDRFDDDQFERQPEKSGRSAPPLALVLFVLFTIAGLIFAFQNGREVRTEFLWLDGQFKFWMTILASVALGIVLDRLILTWWRRARNRS